jgi:hypothetical protein
MTMRHQEIMNNLSFTNPDMYKNWFLPHIEKKSVREKDDEGELTRMVFGVTETKEKRELSYFPRE